MHFAAYDFSGRTAGHGWARLGGWGRFRKCWRPKSGRLLATLVAVPWPHTPNEGRRITVIVIRVKVVESGRGPRLYRPRDPKQMKKGGLPLVVGDFRFPWSPFGPPWSPLGPPFAPVVSRWAPVVSQWAPVVSHWAPVGRRGLPLGGSINNNKHQKNIIKIIESGRGPRLYRPRDPKQMKKKV